MKKKPYWVEIRRISEFEFYAVFLYGRNRFFMMSQYYKQKRHAVQMAKRLAKNLDIEYRENK